MTAAGVTSNNRIQVSHNFQVQCSIAERAWATAQAVMDSATGELYCNVVPSRTLPLTSPFAPEALTLKVSVSDSSSSYSVEETFHVKFVSRFVVMDSNRNVPLRSVVLTSQQTHKTVSVRFASASLTVAPVNPALVSLTSVTAGAYDIDVQESSRSSAFSTTVEFRDTSTGQFENITVLYRTYSESEKVDPEYTDDDGQVLPREHSERASGRSPVVYYLLILSVVLIAISAVVLGTCTGDSSELVKPENSFRGSMTNGAQSAFQPTRAPGFYGTSLN